MTLERRVVYLLTTEHYTGEVGANERRLREAVASVEPTNQDAETAAWERLDSLTKPPRSLGRLEEVAARVACIMGNTRPSVARRAIVVAAGDHGVVAEGVSPYPQDVTWQMVANFVARGAAINQLADAVGADVVVCDVGVARDLSQIEGIVHANVRPGTDNMAEGPAMSREECAQAILVGIDIVEGLASSNVNLLGTGEMGIGNSTAASALTSVFCDVAAAQVVGPGTGLDGAGMSRKATVIDKAIATNQARELDPLGVAAAVGGLEIAALAGVMIGAAMHQIPVLADGFISGSAALVAVGLCPDCRDYILPSHRSAEPGHRVVLDAIGMSPVLELDMRLGEGTGAALAMGIVDAACRMLSGMATFDEAGVSTSEA